MMFTREILKDKYFCERIRLQFTTARRRSSPRNITKRAQVYRNKLRRKRKNICCIYCNVLLRDNNETADHVIPISKGGMNEYINLAPCCRDCNTKKQNKWPWEFVNENN